MPLLNDKQFQMRASENFLARIDDWRRAQPDIPGRAEAIRRLVEIALSVGQGVKLTKSAKGIEEISQQIGALEDKISSMPGPAAPSPEAGMNIMRKAVAKNNLAKLKNRRARIKGDRSK